MSRQQMLERAGAPPDLRLTPEQCERVCAESREAVLELAADGRLIANTPTGSKTGARNARVSADNERVAEHQARSNQANPLRQKHLESVAAESLRSWPRATLVCALDQMVQIQRHTAA